MDFWTQYSGSRSLLMAENVYTAAPGSHAISIFDRDQATGFLTQAGDSSACISTTGDGGACVQGEGLRSVATLTVSPDGATVYAASTSFSNAVLIFDRDPSTGDLTQKSGDAGCIADDTTLADVTTCAEGVALGNPGSVSVSPDGDNVYVASFGSDAISVFDRDTSGALTQKPGADGCIAEDNTVDGVTTCADGIGLDHVVGGEVSPDGSSAYFVASHSDAISIFERDNDTGVLTQRLEADGCIAEDNTVAELTTCTDGVGLSGALGIAFSGDQRSAYVSSSRSDAVAIFDLDDGTGGLTQKPALSGCISETGTGGACTDGRALDGAGDVIVSPDGSSVYTTASFSDAVAVFDRDIEVPPTVTITSGPSGSTTNSSPSFEFSADKAGSTFECRLDSDPFAPCTSPEQYSSLDDGAYEFKVRATDVFGNVSEPDNRSFDLDATAPTTTINSGPSGPTSNGSPTFGFDATEAGASFECSLDSEAFSACVDGQTYSDLPDGTHLFAVRATDGAGNVEDPPVEQSFEVDTVLEGSAVVKRTQEQKGVKILVEVKVKAAEGLAVRAAVRVQIWPRKRAYQLKPTTAKISFRGFDLRTPDAAAGQHKAYEPGTQAGQACDRTCLGQATRWGWQQDR